MGDTSAWNPGRLYLNGAMQGKQRMLVWIFRRTNGNFGEKWIPSYLSKGLEGRLHKVARCLQALVG